MGASADVFLQPPPPPTLSGVVKLANSYGTCITTTVKHGACMRLLKERTN